MITGTLTFKSQRPSPVSLCPKIFLWLDQIQREAYERGRLTKGYPAWPLRADATPVPLQSPPRLLLGPLRLFSGQFKLWDRAKALQAKDMSLNTNHRGNLLQRRPQAPPVALRAPSGPAWCQACRTANKQAPHCGPGGEQPRQPASPDLDLRAPALLNQE